MTLHPDTEPAPPAPRARAPRVLFVQGELHGDEGIVTHLGLLAAGLQRAGWGVSLVTAPPRTPEELPIPWLDELGIRRHRMPFARPPTVRQTFETARVLGHLVRSFRPDVIATCSLSTMPALHLARGWRRTPVVGIPSAYRVPSARRRALGRALPRLAGDRLVAVSTEMKDNITACYGMPEARISVIPHGVDAGQFRPPGPDERRAARALLGVPHDAFAVSVVGRFELGMKRQDLVIDAVGRLREQGCPAVALLVGGGPDEGAIREHAARAGLEDHVLVHGRMDPRVAYWASDVTALPSVREAYGLVIAEAMLCGVVPIRTPDPGAKDQIDHGKTGFLVPYDDADAIADRALELYVDPARRQRMETAALMHARQHLTSDRMVADTVALFHQLARPHAAR